MKRLWHSFYKQYQAFKPEEKMVIYLTVSIFLPFVVTAITLFVVTIYGYKKFGFRTIFESTSKSKSLLLSVVLTTIVALIYHNYLGMGAGFLMIVLILFALFYQRIVTKELLVFLLKIICFMSLVAFIVGVIQYILIVNHMNYPRFQFQIEDDPKYRVDSFFFNANYYAMVCEFVVLIALYLYLFIAPSKKKKHYYLVVIACNLAAIYLTGCRTAWAGFVFAVPLMLYMNHQYRLFTISVVVLVTCAVIVLQFPDILPRDDAGGSLMERIRIWKVALNGISEHPLFGEGPLTYMRIYEKFGGPYTQHAHNIFLEPVLSFGFIPLMFFLVFYFTAVKNIVMLYIKEIDLPLASLMVGVIVVTFVHGMLDFTIQWIQTFLLFTVVVHSLGIYFRKGKERKEFKLGGQLGNE